MPLPPNTRLGRYEVRSQLGAGGMGEVYLVEDTELERQVALKVLPAEVAADEDRVRRFVQEAKAASALNHPNILTVYEIGSFENSRFIATELIRGETLRARLQSEPLSLRETLETAAQIASALNAAHSAGIVHRDIKPENVMLRDDGLVKVLDFGLAKLADRKARSLDSEGETRALGVKTSPGVVMGTVTYMSPEQARGKEVDARTDIWSLGVVVYEMLTRRTPFEGETTNDTIAAILTREPAPLDDDAPPELQRIIRKALQKDRDERYQTIKDFLLDVKNLKRELEFAEELERSQIPHRAQAANVGAGQPSENATAILPAAVETQKSLPQVTSSAEYVVGEVRKHKLGVAFGSLILLALLGAGFWFFFNRTAGAKQIESIAVMPFVNESGNPDVEYLSDGMTETLIRSLSQLPNLNVKARSSVFRYKGKETNPQTIGKELNVQAILNGRVVQRGGQLTLSLELIDAQTENVIWSEQYNRRQADLVSLQSEVARDVSSKLKLSGADAAKVEKTYTANPEAYQLYLKGRYFWNKRTPESLRQAVELYKQAIEKDPSFALALTGLAETYVLFSFYGVAPPKESMPQAKTAIARALAIDDSLAEAHAARGKYLAFFEYDRTGSEREFRRAIELNPKYATAHHWLGLDFLVLTKRFDEGIRELELAGEIDPLSPVIGSDTASAFGYAGRFDEAIEQAKSTLALEPGFSYAHTMIGYALDGKGQYAEAIKEFEKAIELGDEFYARAMLIRSLVRSGKRSEAERQMEALKSLSTKSYVPKFCFAIAYTALGDKETAIAMLEKDVEERSSYVVTSGIDHALDELRDDPRFKDLLKRMNLPE